MKMKKGIIIAISAIAAAGLGYFIYRKIADRNKEIIQDGTFTIKIDDTASTGIPSEQYFSQEAEDIDLDAEIDEILSYYDEYYDEAPSWFYDYDY